MIKVIVGIFLVLVIFLVGALISGDIIVFFAWWLLPAYAVLLIIYFALYAVIGLITDKPLTTKIKLLLIIPTISIPWGYTKWTEYRDAQSVQEQQNYVVKVRVFTALLLGKIIVFLGINNFKCRR